MSIIIIIVITRMKQGTEMKVVKKKEYVRKLCNLPRTMIRSRAFTSPHLKFWGLLVSWSHS